MPALDGMKVLDLTQYEAGTTCTQYLAWFGATVVKIERPGDGDPGRSIAGSGRDALYFLSFNHNKKSLALDLSVVRGREIFLRLVPRFDVVVENFTLGTMEKLGLAYEILRELNPGIIYASVKGFGASGPFAGFKCFDMVAQAAGGAFSVTGESGGRPMLPGPTYADTGSGMHCAMGILAAYVQRLRTGQGQAVEISMQETVANFMREKLAQRDWRQTPLSRRGTRSVAPTDLYRCAPGGPNDYVYIMVATTEMWDALITAIDRPDLAVDPRFLTVRDRNQNGDALQAEVESWTQQRTKFEAMEHLGAAGVPCSAVYDTEDLFTDRHLAARGQIRVIDHPVRGRVQMLAPPVHLSESAVEMVRAPLLGEHTEEVLRAELGMGRSEVEELARLGIVGMIE